MAEVPTKPGVRPWLNHSAEDTLSMRPDDPEAAATPTRSLPANERYRLGAELGRGGMGRVVEAFDRQLGRTVALKEVLPRSGEGVARRFAREVQLTARLEHPSIVPLYDSGTTSDGRPFYVMRRVTGRPLDQLMAKASGLEDRLTLLPPVLAAIDAVAHAHRRGVIHRDLKPANILVGELGETVVIDWGLAKVIGEDDDKPGTVIVASDSLRTQMGSVFGTPGFMAPEQARGEELDPRSDVYALGATLYQLLAGAPPHGGTSATEVIERTGSREVAPVDTVAPGAPPELVAIVGKAVAFDPDGRYPDAGALGEDVRRFLAGQLVAAHHYTRRQRLWRFARRHRAALVVAATATLAVALIAGAAVRGVVAERDQANRARAEAARNQRAAEQARDELQRRSDQLVVMQARGLLADNPTHAAAVLKELPAQSTRLGDARAVAQAAAVRGVAWALEVPRDTAAFSELSADGGAVFRISRDGTLRVWDVERRRFVVERRFAPDVRALWVGRAVLVTGEAGAELFDPFTGATQALALAPVTFAVATARGDRVAYLTDAGAQLFDVAKGAGRTLWPGRRPAQIAIAADGSWIALADETTVAILDGEGRELTTRAAAAVRLLGSRFGQVAYATHDQVAICTLAPKLVWTEVDLSAARPATPLDYVFRGRDLAMYMGTGQVMLWNGSRLSERMKLRGLNLRMLEAGDGLLVVPGIDGKLHVGDDLSTGELHLPLALGAPRVHARPGVPRVVAVGDGAIVGFELAASFPTSLGSRLDITPTFVDDDTVLFLRLGSTWEWYDVRARTTTPFTYQLRGVPRAIDIDPGDGRVLVQELADDTALVVLRKGSAEQRRVARGPAVWGRLLPGGALVFGVGDGRVFALTGDGEPREVTTLDGASGAAASLGGTRFAALSTTGELVRGNLDGSGLVRSRIPGATAPITGAIAGDGAGRVIIAVDRRLLLWDRDLVELATLELRIDRIVAVGTPTVDDAVLLQLADHSVVRMALAAGAPAITAVGPASQPPLFSADGELIIAETVNGQSLVHEVATGATWDLPAYHAAFRLYTIAPSGRRFIEGGYGKLALWTLPLAPPELPTWLDEQTNALTDGDHALTWPWLRARP